jgi:hypothetical protein
MMSSEASANVCSFATSTTKHKRKRYSLLSIKYTHYAHPLPYSRGQHQRAPRLRRLPHHNGSSNSNLRNPQLHEFGRCTLHTPRHDSEPKVANIIPPGCQLDHLRRPQLRFAMAAIHKVPRRCLAIQRNLYSKRSLFLRGLRAHQFH